MDGLGADMEVPVSELEQIRAQMMTLARQVEQQAASHTSLVSENNTRFENAIARWKRHCDSLSSQLAKHTEVTSLSPTEMDQRAAHADSVRKGGAPTTPLLADGAAIGGALESVITAGSVDANY